MPNPPADVTTAADILLFSYGTLRLPRVQLATYGRRLNGRPDSLCGFRLAPLEISSPEVVAISGAAVHDIARWSGDPADRIDGIVFWLSAAELAATDRYEVDAYARAEVDLASGTSAFAYLGPDL
jgi:hypothetical protein